MKKSNTTEVQNIWKTLTKENPSNKDLQFELEI